MKCSRNKMVYLYVNEIDQVKCDHSSINNLCVMGERRMFDWGWRHLGEDGDGEAELTGCSGSQRTHGGVNFIAVHLRPARLLYLLGHWLHVHDGVNLVLSQTHCYWSGLLKLNPVLNSSSILSKKESLLYMNMAVMSPVASSSDWKSSGLRAARDSRVN